MADQNQHGESPIIIKKGKKCGHGHHGGAWKVAYADFVTAMMALFIVLWVLAQSEEVKTSIAHYFQNPTILGISGSKSFMEGQGPGSGQQGMEEKIKSEMEEKEAERKSLQEKANNIIESLESNPDFADILSQVDIQVTDEGLRIELLDKDDSFFELSSAKLKPKAVMILSIIGSQISELNNKIVVEGHTDARPYPKNNRGYTNYELSADRANAARNILQKNGVSDEQIDQIRGYASHRLRNIKDPNDRINRRISILVELKQITL